MKLVSFQQGSKQRVGVYADGKIFPLNTLDPLLPYTMQALLQSWSTYITVLHQRLQQDWHINNEGLPVDSIQLLAPVPQPNSLRDGYAFRQHVASARRNRGVAMISAFDEYPVFYFGNHSTVYGPGKIYCMPDHFVHLDFELECAIVICKKGKNIKAPNADQYIGGLMIMNDFSARQLQQEEMLLNLGPAKGKDFATTLGPWLVTTDELERFEVAPRPGHVGKSWNLPMIASINGTQVGRGSLRDMDWTFAEIIERASYGVELYPGDVIGSGTVGTGCLLELNGTGTLNDPTFVPKWLLEGDHITLQIGELGTLDNIIAAELTTWSILEQKKNGIYQKDRCPTNS